MSDVRMVDDAKLPDDELLRNGLKYLDDALSYFMEIEDTTTHDIMTNIAYGLLTVGEAIHKNMGDYDGGSS